MSYESSPAFTELYSTIKTQMEILLEEWKDENRHVHNECEDCDDDCEGYDYEKDKEYYMDDFMNEYTNNYFSYEYYEIDDEMLNESYREGSSWIMDKMLADYDNHFTIVKTMTQINKDNREYLKQLVYYIGYEL